MELSIGHWIDMAERNVPIDNLIGLFPDKIDRLPFILGHCCNARNSRWDDVQHLCNHPNVDLAESAKSEFEMHLHQLQLNTANDRRIAQLPGYFKTLFETVNKIRYWYPSIHYPHKSTIVPESNFCITGDGMGIAYFRASGDKPDSTVLVIQVSYTMKCLEPFLNKEITLEKLNAILEELVLKANQTPWEIMVNKLERKQYPSGSVPDDFECFGPMSNLNEKTL